MDSLPIDEVLNQIGESLEATPRLVLEAPPGAGKTTRVPWSLARRRGFGKVLVSEPRRIAAKLAAQRVADEIGERLGDTIGYNVRLEQVAGPSTRVLYMTDGVLLKRLVVDPRLDGVGVVILDEEHDSAYKQDQEPRYHARSFAEHLATETGAVVILGSAAVIGLTRYAEPQHHHATAPTRRSVM